jgi:hypothetical protein
MVDHLLPLLEMRQRWLIIKNLRMGTSINCRGSSLNIEFMDECKCQVVLVN